MQLKSKRALIIHSSCLLNATLGTRGFFSPAGGALFGRRQIANRDCEVKPLRNNHFKFTSATEELNSELRRINVSHKPSATLSSFSHCSDTKKISSLSLNIRSQTGKFSVTPCWRWPQKIILV